MDTANTELEAIGSKGELISPLDVCVGVDLGQDDGDTQEHLKELQRWNDTQAQTISSKDKEIEELKGLLNQILNDSRTVMNVALALRANGLIGTEYRLSRKQSLDRFKQLLNSGRIAHETLKINKHLNANDHPQAFCKHFTITLKRYGLSKCEACHAVVNEKRQIVGDFSS